MTHRQGSAGPGRRALAILLAASLLGVCSVALAANVRYAYDGARRLVKAEYPTGSINYVYDRAGSLVAVSVAPTSTARNYQGLWWASPPGSESGWGINFAHQGDVVFATWFTYDASGNPTWFAAELRKSAEGVFAGNVITVTGPPFNAVPWDLAKVVETVIGTMTVTFADAGHASMTYTVHGVTQTKSIVPQQFAGPAVASCVWGLPLGLAAATNYQDLWWAAPAGSESGWGVNFTQQGNIIFLTWFTYGADGKPTWLIAVAERTSRGVYSGPISTVKGNPFSAVPWDLTKIVETVVGQATITFADGNQATFAYTVNGISQTKAITRQIFGEPGTLCQ